MQKIIHIDMDCFFAAVEMRDNPKLKGLPVAVGSAPEHRGVLATCNYIARKYGLHSAMPSSYAYRLCPDLVLLPVRHDYYKQESALISKIFKDYTPFIEPISLDEAYLDVSNVTLCRGSATLMAREIRARILKERGLTASAGIAENKFLSKVASDWNKPNGQFTIPPERSASFAAALDIGRLPGVGTVSKKKLNAKGIFKCSDVLEKSLGEIVHICGTFGFTLYQFAKGIDKRPVVSERTRKSLSTEDTFDADLKTEKECLFKLVTIYEEFLRRLKISGFKHTENAYIKCFVKIKYDNFRQTTIERSFLTLSLENFKDLFTERYAECKAPVRLIGLGIHLPYSLETGQLALHFEEAF